MFIEFFTMDGKPVSISLLNISHVQWCNDTRHTNITTTEGTTLVVKGEYEVIRNQIRAMCK